MLKAIKNGNLILIKNKFPFLIAFNNAYLKSNPYLSENKWQKRFLWNVKNPVAITACTNVATYAMPHWIRTVERSDNSGGGGGAIWSPYVLVEIGLTDLPKDGGASLQGIMKKKSIQYIN